jgi:hypothetical protein
LFARVKGGFDHDGRFPNLAAAVNITAAKRLGLMAAEQHELIVERPPFRPDTWRIHEGLGFRTLCQSQKGGEDHSRSNA